MIFPIIIYPYTSRIIGDEGIGRVAFSLSVVQYFIFLGSLGIPIYGIREISKYKDNVAKRSKIFFELLIIQVGATLLSLIIYLIVILKWNVLTNNLAILFILGINLFFNTLSLDWFYKGIEEYKFISVRNILVKLVALSYMFIFVKSKQDYLQYTIIFIITLTGVNIINAFNIKKFVSFERYTLEIKHHIKSILIIFVSVLAISIYVNLDITMLGILSGEKHVAYYSVAIKLNRLLITLVTAFGTVIVPKISNYVYNKNNEEIKKLLKIALSYIFIISIPAIIILNNFAKEIILLMFGEQFKPAISTFKITNLIILFTGLNNFMGIQVLFPHNKEKYYTFSIIVGVIFNIILNYILIPIYKNDGAAIATLMTELIILILLFYFTKNQINKILFSKNLIKILFSGLLMLVLINLSKLIIFTSVYRLIIGSVICSLGYLIILYILKEEFIIKLVKQFSTLIRVVRKESWYK